MFTLLIALYTRLLRLRCSVDYTFVTNVAFTLCYAFTMTLRCGPVLFVVIPLIADYTTHICWLFKFTLHRRCAAAFHVALRWTHPRFGGVVAGDYVDYVTFRTHTNVAFVVG